MTDAKRKDDFRRLSISMKSNDFALVLKLKQAAELKASEPVALAEVIREACRCLAEREGVS